MGEVVSVRKWAERINTTALANKLLSVDKLIRSRIEPPALGSWLWNFAGGKAIMTGQRTTISGGDTEIVIECGVVSINGNLEYAAQMFCSIHRELELVQARFMSDSWREASGDHSGSR